MEMELVLKTSRKSDKNMVKNETFNDETILTKTDKPTKPYISRVISGNFTVFFGNYYYYYKNNREKRYYKLQDFSGVYCAF